MLRSLFALTLVLSILPITALAQDANARPPLTDQQKQAVRATFQRFQAQEEQFHQQMRYQVLSALTPSHRRQLATFIGALAIEVNPDVQAAARQIDRALLSSERTRILAAQQVFETQRRQLSQQMRTELQSELPAAYQNWRSHGNGPPSDRQQLLDAGTIALMTLTPHLPMRPGRYGGPWMQQH